MLLLVLLHTPPLPALQARTPPRIHPSGFSHRPWWHSRGALSDYATCRPRGEDDVALNLERLAAGGKPQDAALGGTVKPAHFREEFFNVAEEVPELAALFVHADVQPELLPPDRPSRLPLGLHAGSLYQRLGVLYRERSAERSAAGAHAGDTSIGYEMQRVWLEDMFGDLGGPRGRSVVQRTMGDARNSTALPEHLPDTDDAEPSHFYLPAFLCQELEMEPHASGPATQWHQSVHIQCAAAEENWQNLQTHGLGQGGESLREAQTDSVRAKSRSKGKRKTRKKASSVVPALT